MAVTTTDGVPSLIRSGNTARFTVSDADHPASTWSAKLYLTRAGVAVTNFSASESGDTYSFVISAAQSAALLAGNYVWALRFTQTASSEVEDGATGQLQVSQNIGATPDKSFAAQALANIETAITTLSSSTNSSVSFNGQSFTKAQMGDLMSRREMLRAEVIREQQAAAATRGEDTGVAYQVRFQ